MYPEAGHFRSFWTFLRHLRAYGQFKDTFLFEDKGSIPSFPSLDARLSYKFQSDGKDKCFLRGPC